MSFFIFILLLPLIIILYFLIINWRSVRAAYKLKQAHDSQRKAYEEEKAREERARKHTHPEQSSVEMINDAHLDLEGGEYIDYEEVK